MASRHSIEEKVVINLGMSGILMGIIDAVKFDTFSVLYDIKVYPFCDEEENKDQCVLLKDIPGYYIEKFDDHRSNVGRKLHKN